MSLCKCGCGKSPNNGKSFVHGHNAKGKFHYAYNGGKRTQTSGYIQLRVPDHPKADQGGYIGEHILKCEKALGKYLPPGAEPHHIDGNPGNNQNSNLVLCQDRKYHFLIERRTKALKACGHANWIKCWVCQKWDNQENLFIKTDGSGYHKNCYNKWRRKSKNQGEPHGIR